MLARETLELFQVRELLAHDNALIDKDFLLESIDRLPQEDLITSTSLENIIRLLRDNVDKHDYLKRSDATDPIDFLPVVSPVFKALTLLINYAVKLREKELNKLSLAELIPLLNIEKEHEKYYEKPSECYPVIIKNYHFQLLTGEYSQSDHVSFWRENHRHYLPGHYPKNHYRENKKLFDRLDIDLIVREIHYITLPLEKAIQLHNSHHQMQPGFVSVATDEAVQYDPNTGSCSELLSNHFEGNASTKDWKNGADNLCANRGRYPLRLMASGITNCHAVLVRDSLNRIFILHVSPASVTGGSDNAFFYRKPKTAYLDLHPNYQKPELGLAAGEIEVVVVDRGGYFNEESFQRKLPSNVSVKSINVTYADFGVQGCEYCVCYLPEKNKIMVVPRYKDLKSIEIENVFVFGQLPVAARADYRPAV